MSPDFIVGMPHSFQFRVLCGIYFLTAMRTNELPKLEINQVTSYVIKRIKVFIIKRKLGAIGGATRNAREGIEG